MITVERAIKLIPVWQEGTFAKACGDRLVMCTPRGSVDVFGVVTDLYDEFPIIDGKVSAHDIRAVLGY